MTRSVLLLLAAGLSVAAWPASALDFETCVPRPGEAPAFTVEHAGKTYGLRSEECRDEFLSDPERYAQLYEALLELREQAGTSDAGDVSLVPS